MMRRQSVLAALACAFVGLAGWQGARIAQAHGQEPPGIGPKPPQPDLVNYRAAIPRGVYQTLVISARSAPRGVDIIPFVIRARDSTNNVSDFTFFVPTGTTQTVTFPAGWANQTDAVLYALEGAEFAGWGVTMPNAGIGSMVRFERVERESNREAADRERERDFEAFLREQQRNK